MLVPIGCLKPGDNFTDLDPDPRLDTTFTVLNKDCQDRVLAKDEFGYNFTFEPTKIVRIN